jgi:hypothetical protein
MADYCGHFLYDTVRVFSRIGVFLFAGFGDKSPRNFGPTWPEVRRVSKGVPPLKLPPPWEHRPLFLFFGGGRGRGGWPPEAVDCRQRSGAGFAVEWRGRKRGRFPLILFPVFGKAMTRQKSGLSMGLRVEICDSKYYPALDSPDRRSGLIAGRSYVTIYRFLTARKAA